MARIRDVTDAAMVDRIAYLKSARMDLLTPADLWALRWIRRVEVIVSNLESAYLSATTSRKRRSAYGKLKRAMRLPNQIALRSLPDREQLRVWRKGMPESSRIRRVRIFKRAAANGIITLPPHLKKYERGNSVDGTSC